MRSSQDKEGPPEIPLPPGAGAGVDPMLQSLNPANPVPETADGLLPDALPVPGTDLTIPIGSTYDEEEDEDDDKTTVCCCNGRTWVKIVTIYLFVWGLLQLIYGIVSFSSYYRTSQEAKLHPKVQDQATKNALFYIDFIIWGLAEIFLAALLTFGVKKKDSLLMLVWVLIMLAYTILKLVVKSILIFLNKTNQSMIDVVGRVLLMLVQILCNAFFCWTINFHRNELCDVM